MERVSKALDTSKYVVSVFLEIKKDHNTLLEKLKQYGMNGNIYSWFDRYLSNRKQYVEYNHFKSNTKTITHGVPQS